MLFTFPYQTDHAPFRMTKDQGACNSVSIFWLPFNSLLNIRTTITALSLFLLQACAILPVNEQDKSLYTAIQTGNTQEVKRLLDSGAHINGTDEKGNTPLHLAATNGALEVAKTLIARGANINAKALDGETPLHIVAYTANADIAELFIRSGADVNAKAKEDVTPLEVALMGIVKPVTSPPPASEEAATVRLVKLLIDNGADINAKDAHGGTPLHIAAVIEHLPLMEMLIAKGALLNAKTDEGVTPLYDAVKADRTKASALLIARGADVNMATKSNYTPLLQAAHRGNREMAELLLVHGANADVQDSRGRSPLFWSIMTALSKAPSASGQTNAAYFGKMMSGLSAREQQKIQQDLRSMKQEWVATAELLIDHGADVNITVNGDFPLYLAANLGNQDLVAALVDKGANINGIKGAAETPLHAAIAEKHRDVAEVLIRKGANVNIQNRWSNSTPLHFLALHMDDEALAELLLAHGADINAKNKYGLTPLATAIKFGNNRVANLLKIKGAQ